MQLPTKKPVFKSNLKDIKFNKIKKDKKKKKDKNAILKLEWLRNPSSKPHNPKVKLLQKVSTIPDPSIIATPKPISTNQTRSEEKLGPVESFLASIQPVKEKLPLCPGCGAQMQVHQLHINLFFTISF